MKRLLRNLLLLSFILFFKLGCNNSFIQSNYDLVIYSPHPLEFIEVIVREFEFKYNVKVAVVSAGTNQLINMINSSTQPADVIWGGSLSILLANQHLFEPFISENEVYFKEDFLNSSGRITQFSIIPSVIMINNNLVPQNSIHGYMDLLDNLYFGRIAFADPNFSSSSFEHIVNQLYAMGEGDPNKGWDFVSNFIIQLNGQLLSSSRAVFEGVAEGRFAIGLTFEEAAVRYVFQGFPVSIVYPVEGTIAKADGISIIKNAPNIKNAQLFVNFVTSYDIQHFMSSTLHRRSIRTDVSNTTILKPLNEIHLIKDDPYWSSRHKLNILENFNSIMR